MMSLPSLQETLEYQVLVCCMVARAQDLRRHLGLFWTFSGFSVPGRFVVVGVGAGIYKTVSCRGGGDVQTDRQTDRLSSANNHHQSYHIEKPQIITITSTHYTTITTTLQNTKYLNL